MALSSAGMYLGSLVDYARARLLTQRVQTCKPPLTTAWPQVQEVAYALYSDGKHLPLSARLSIAPFEHARPRPLPDGRSV